MKKVITGLVVLIAIVVAALAFFWKKDAGQKYGMEAAVIGDIEAAVTATGTVNPVTTVLVGTQVSGTIKAIFVDFNSPVKKGQVIAEIDPAIVQAQVDQARANYLSAKANLDKSKAARKDAMRSFERNKGLYGRNLIAKSDLDTAETNYESAEAQIAVAEAQIAQTEAALRLAETNLQYTRIASPVDGIVVSRNVDAGQTVAASFQTPTLFTIAQDLTKMQIDASVAEADIGKIEPGLPVEFTVDAYPGQTFKGGVSEVRNSPIVVQNVVTYDVVIKVDNPELKLKPGMTANVSIIYSSRKGVLTVPNAALRFVPPKPPNKGGVENKEAGGGRVGGGNGAPGVWVLEDGKPRKVKVAAGISDGNSTEILSGGIKEGQELIVESLEKPKGQSQSGPRMF
ncbi:MAG: efflux RND transporter periplasmic adaptor subunit [Deltaproteobacteria bacterium]|nr:efflux RND transporter periplasmic adaptor subunit [Deltaproteobacteria bacterium]